MLKRGRFAEAKMSTQQALELLPEDDSLRPAVLRQLDNCDRLLALEAKLPAVIAGQAQPADNRERLGLGEVCKLQRRYAAASRFYRDAFAVDPKLADDVTARHCYNAACCVVLAAAGQGIDADKLDNAERTRLREQALSWLRADLALWERRLEGGKPEDRALIRTTLQHWQGDPDLAPVRDGEALKKLPREEAEAWRTLWADVAQSLHKAAHAK